MTWHVIDELTVYGWSLKEVADKIILTHPKHGIKIISHDLKNVISMKACEMSLYFEIINSEWADIQSVKNGTHGKSTLTTTDVLPGMLDMYDCFNEDAV